MPDIDLEADWPTRAPQRAASAFHFRTLGQLVLERGPDAGQVGVSQRRKLVLLAYLALAVRPVARDTLVEMFWGDEEEERARHSLSNALSFLRGVLGPDAIAARKADVSLAARGSLRVDAIELAAAARAQDHAQVLALYQGPFLDRVYVRDSSSFDSWVTAERTRLEALFFTSSAAVCTASAAAADWTRCAAVARPWLEASPLSPEPALHLLHSLRAGRTPEHRRAALAEYERLRLRLAQDFDAEPHPHVEELVRRIRERAQADVPAVNVITLETAPLPADAEVVVAPAQLAEVAPDVVTTPAAPMQSVVAPTTPVRRTTRSRRALALTGAAVTVVVVAIAGVAIRSRHAYPALTERHRPLIAVTDIANVRGDTAAAWLEDGIAQLLASDLARSAMVEVVTPDRIRDTRQRENLPASGALDERTALDVASRLGASLAVRGGFTRGAGGYLLDVTVRDVATARDVGSITVSGPDPTTLADRAAARMLQWAIAGDARPRYADLEAPNLVAYQHFIRALQARAEGRYLDTRRELDAAIAIDSTFASALAEREEAAIDDGDTVSQRRLAVAMRRAHFSQWDIERAALDSAEHNGERVRSTELAQRLVADFPHDPRSWSRLARLYALRGDWAAAERTTQGQLALDSLAIESGTGPCIPCEAYRALVEIRLSRGDLPAAEQAARRWLALQPDLPGAWANLSQVLSSGRRHEAALEAERRALMLSGNDPTYQIRYARTLVVAGRLDEADSVLRTARNLDADTRSGATDIHVLVLRERGRFRESIAVSDSVLRHGPGEEALLYEEMDALGRLGSYAAVERLFGQRVAPSARTRAMESQARGDAARWFSWTRALEANALAESGDTLRLRMIADSLRVIGPQSYYGRDWGLWHHVTGLLAMRGGRPADAIHEFQQARWGVSGWTATVAWLARAQIAIGRPNDAVSTLRGGYVAPLDAMGRYVPRTELDYLMSVAFRRAGAHDSAAVYAARVRHAWSGADAEVRRRLDAL